MENHARTQVLGADAAPYETQLAASCATASHYRSVGSPSLPNYLGATAGDTFGVSDDDPPANHPITADNIFRLVRDSGGSAVSYQEAMPAPCALESAGRYAVKHDPAAYYSSPDDRAACRRDDLSLGTPDAGALHDALASGDLPTFAFVTPDLCNDTHDCGIDRGDNWLATWIPALLASDAYTSGTTAVFVVWDEPSPMPFIAVAPSVRPGTTVSTRVDHYALLRTTEEMLGLTPLLGSAATAPSIRSELPA